MSDNINAIETYSKHGVTDIAGKHGVTIDTLLKHGAEGLRASRILKDRDGEVIEEVPDWNVRHKYFHDFLELLKLIDGKM